MTAASATLYGLLSSTDASFTLLTVKFHATLSDKYGRRPFLALSALGLGAGFYMTYHSRRVRGTGSPGVGGPGERGGGGGEGAGGHERLKVGVGWSGGVLSFLAARCPRMRISEAECLDRFGGQPRCYSLHQSLIKKHRLVFSSWRGIELNCVEGVDAPRGRRHRWLHQLHVQVSCGFVLGTLPAALAW